MEIFMRNAPDVPRLIATACVFVSLLGVACSDDPIVDSDTASADAGSDDSGATSEDGSAAADSSDASANDTVANADASPRNPQCAKFDDGKYGQKIQWYGYKKDKFHLTCNSCRGGYPNIVGRWRFVDGTDEDPRTPLKSKDGTAYAEVLEFDGNVWTNTIVGTDLGKPVTATIVGWYFCADSTELKGAPAVFVQQTVKPEGAFGNTSNSVWRADILTNGNNRIQLGDAGFERLDKAGTGDLLYCRIGSVVDVNGTKVPCNDPLK
jgi:hypothetical protein